MYKCYWLKEESRRCQPVIPGFFVIAPDRQHHLYKRHVGADDPYFLEALDTRKNRRFQEITGKLSSPVEISADKKQDW